MDKNNDNIQVNKISKWAEAPVSIKNLRNYISESWKNYAAPPCCPRLDPSCQDSICESMMTLLESVLDDYNKLEEESKKLLENSELYLKAHLKLCKEVTELEKEKIDLEVRMDQSDDLRYRAAKYAWAIKTILKKATFSPGHVAEELRFMARKSTTPKDIQERWEGYADEFLGEHSKLVDKINRLEKKNEELETALAFCEMTGFAMKGQSDRMLNEAKRARNNDPDGDDN